MKNAEPLRIETTTSARPRSCRSISSADGRNPFGDLRGESWRTSSSHGSGWSLHATGFSPRHRTPAPRRPRPLDGYAGARRGASNRMRRPASKRKSSPGQSRDGSRSRSRPVIGGRPARAKGAGEPGERAARELLRTGGEDSGVDLDDRVGLDGRRARRRWGRCRAVATSAARPARVLVVQRSRGRAARRPRSRAHAPRRSSGRSSRRTRLRASPRSPLVESRRRRSRASARNARISSRRTPRRGPHDAVVAKRDGARRGGRDPRGALARGGATRPHRLCWWAVATRVAPASRAISASAA